jgi:hypothetical protein
MAHAIFFFFFHSLTLPWLDHRQLALTRRVSFGAPIDGGKEFRTEGDLKKNREKENKKGMQCLLLSPVKFR